MAPAKLDPDRPGPHRPGPDSKKTQGNDEHSATGEMTRSRSYGTNLPPFQPGMRIGLYGGSFNPAHAGHRHVALTALKRLKLDRLWCLVTPGNPLKDISGLPSLSERIRATADIMDHPAVAVTGLEAKAGTRFTAATLDWLHHRTKGCHLVWVMGADNLKQFHKWQRWQGIMVQIPVAIIDRPGYSLAPLYATAAHHFAQFRLSDDDAGALATLDRPGWTFLYGPRSDLSSTSLRQASRVQKLPNEQQP